VSPGEVIFNEHGLAPRSEQRADSVATNLDQLETRSEPKILRTELYSMGDIEILLASPDSIHIRNLLAEQYIITYFFNNILNTAS
jgi:hypothetical protein